MFENKGFNVAIVGATGAVGTRMIDMLKDSSLPVRSLALLASKRSAGQTVEIEGRQLTIEEASPEAFNGIDIALFSAGGQVSRELAPEAVKRGAVVIDNTSAFRMTEGVPLVVPEVNPHALNSHNGIIANPNCSTIQMVAALEPIRKKFGLERIIVSTYQAVSGSGVSAIEELNKETGQVLNGERVEPAILPVKGDKKHYQIAYNAIPQIDVFQENGYTFEEMKMINETKKIMEDSELKVAATCVRLPVATGHAESVYIELNSSDASPEDLKKVLDESPGIVLQDDPKEQLYPMPINAVGKKEVFVGRIRKDPDSANGYHLWIVSDNLLKGAAWNSVQIAETMHQMELISYKKE